MKSQNPTKSEFTRIRDRIKTEIKRRDIKYYGVIIKTTCPEIKTMDLYNVMNPAEPQQNWRVLAELGKLVGIEVEQPLQVA